MNLVIDGNLVYPPSEISCVRDITLYGAVWGNFDVVIEMYQEHIDHVWRLLKSRGAMDYVEDIVCIDTVSGLRISDSHPKSNIKVNYICCENLNFIIGRLLPRRRL